MTNRTPEPAIAYTEPQTKAEEVDFLIGLLEEMGHPITLANVTELLQLGLENAPDQWQLTVADLPGLLRTEEAINVAQ